MKEGPENTTTAEFYPEMVLDFWFPDDGHWKNAESHRAFWNCRMQGGMDQAICEKFAELTEAAAKGLLDHWSQTPRGRLALIIALDQFPRSLWRDTPAAFGQDTKAARLALEALKDGEYSALTEVWEKQFILICLSHCEGPEHLRRMDRVLDLTRQQIADAPSQLREFYGMAIDRTVTVRNIIATYGRHPHRNSLLGRVSTIAEEAYIKDGIFPHQGEIRKSDAE